MSAAQESMARIGNDVATVSPTPAAMAGILSRFVAGRATPERREPDASADDEFFQERAAIREFDAGLSTEDAEILADHDCLNLANAGRAPARAGPTARR